MPKKLNQIDNIKSEDAYKPSLKSNEPDPEYMKLVRKMLANKLKEKLVVQKSTKNIREKLA